MMKLVYADRHRDDHPTDREVPEYGRGFPEVPARAEAIRTAVEAAGLGTFVPPDDFGMEPIQAVHAGGLLEHLRAGYRDSRTGPKDTHPYVAHTFAVRGRRDSRGEMPGGFGAWAFDTSAPLFERTWLATLRASQAAVTAAAHVAATGGVAYSLGRPPGHHAGRDFYGGFCYLNHAAVAAKYLQGKANGRVATLDIDYHHGNGTQEIFYSDPTVLSCSLHADPRQDYPFYWGAANERGDGDADGTNVNLPLPIGTTDAAYLKSLEKALQAIADFAPAALVVSCGFDLMAGDPVPRDGGFCITVEGLKSIARQIRQLQLPTVIVQEGGYNVARLGEYAVAVLESFQ
jgi:acetoin utilization deacetylase AcuC-like enzyme